jgi:hypothetical protein
MSVMPRLNMTLDDDTDSSLTRHAKREGARRATFARALLREGLLRRDEADRRKKLAADYAAGRPDAKALLADLESPQADLLRDDEG